jgi:serine/threonine protein kinase
MASPSASDATLKPAPKELGAYEIIAEIARGGMGSVYLARRAGEGGFRRLFAVKAMHPHLAEDHAFVEMLRDEARIAAQLHHQNVVPVVDIGTHDQVPYVVMEYIDGCALSALLARNKTHRPPELLSAILLDALEGLHAAHSLRDDDGNELRLVHRDVTPQNILVGVDGSGRLTDFGIAKAEARVTTTRPGVWKGKFAYMSPEQLVGDGENVDHRADIFAAGAVLWTALTGQRLFRADTDGATLHNVLHKLIVPPSTVGLTPPPAFDAVCLRALERDRDKRFQSAREMADALRKAATSIGTRAAVAEWVTTSFPNEIESRRAAIRAAAHDPRRSSSSSISIPALPQLSGPPSLASEQSGLVPVPVLFEGAPPSIGSNTVRSSLAPHAEATDAAAARLGKGRMTWAVAFGVPLFLFALVFVVYIATRGSDGATTESPPNTAALPTLPTASVAKVESDPPKPVEPATSASAGEVNGIDSLPKEPVRQARVRERPSTKSTKSTKAEEKPTTKSSSTPSTTGTPTAKPTSKPEVQFEKNPYVKPE